MKRCAILLVCCLGAVCGLPGRCEGGRRAPGKYCGTPIFDRWDGCTLYSGIYVMYISEKVKESLRPYAGKAIQIDAQEVNQPINPGDGLIGKFVYLGAAPTNQAQAWVKLAGLHLESSVKIDEDSKPVATMSIENQGDEPVKLFSQELALTLLTKQDEARHRVSFVSDGPSFALITRQNFEVGAREPRWQGKGVRGGTPYFWTIGKANALPHSFTLVPKEKKQILVRFDLPDGQYDFLFGYGGGVHAGKCLAGNLSAFDVKDSRARRVKVAGRK
ncbi:MAG: hypothetical protein ACYTAS_15260 [Planctomycetota bacterium]|jgi:hypothetical protein